MSEQPQTPRRGMKPWLRVVLILSLGLNLLIVGVVVGGIARSLNDEMRPPRLDSMAGPLTRALSRDDRKALGHALRESYRDNRPSRAQMRAEFDGLIADLTAEPFDPEAVAARLARQRGIVSDRLELGQRLLLDRLEEMSPAERAAFAGRLRDTVRKIPDGKRFSRY